MKRFLCVLAVLLVLSGFGQIVCKAADVFYEHSVVTSPSRGVEYERITQMTSIGFRDIHILRVPLDDPYINIRPVTSQQAVGRRESTSALLSAAGAVGGVNADFFNTTPNYGFHLGPMIYDGQLLAARTDHNVNRNEFAAFLINDEGNPFFRYMQIDVRLYHNGVRNLLISAFNNVGTEMNFPMAFNRLVMADTAALDIRFPGTAKIVSNGTQIVYISAPGETVTIPEGGFIVVFPPAMVNQRFNYRLGDFARLSVTNNINIDFSAIQSGIGGGGMLLLAGEVANDGGHIITGRHPRTAVGVCREGKTLILMVVDGRNTSVGATHTELAELMRLAGAFTAMHFDGGGSSTMVVQEQGEHYTVVNTPADGAQRRVVNALGVFDNAEPGELSGIVLDLEKQKVAVGTPVATRIYGLDKTGLRFPLPKDANIAYFANDRTMGFWLNGFYTPLTAGTHTLNVWYEQYWAVQTLYVVNIAELHAEPVSVLHGEQRLLRFSGTAVDGTTLTDVQVTDLTVVPVSLGRVENGYFHSLSAGVGYIRAVLGNITLYIPVSVGRASAPVSLRGGGIAFSGYPSFVTGKTEITLVGTVLIPQLTYNVITGPETQAAHMVFDPPITLPASPGETPVALRLQVHGYPSGHWLRGRVTDGNGLAHNINFTTDMDFTGWLNLTAQLPVNAPGPFTLDRLWMAALGSEVSAEYTVYFNALQTLYAPLPLPEVPVGSRFRDPMMTHGEFAGIPGGGNIVLDVPDGAGVYRFNRAENMAIIQLAANPTGLTERRQWEYIVRDIKIADPYHVVVLLNENPLDFPPLIFELFHNMMRTFAEEGRTVFVVSPVGSFAIRDGVRYIGTSEQIRFFTDGKQIWWYGG